MGFLRETHFFFNITDTKSQAVENSSRAIGKWVIAP